MKAAQKHRMFVQLFFMLGHPGETRKELQESVDLPRRLEKMGFHNIEAVGYHVTLPIPGTPYFDWCVQKGKISPSLVEDYIQGKLGDGYFGHWPYLVPDGLTYEDLIEFRKKGHCGFHLRPRYVLRKLMDDLKHPSQLWTDVMHAYYLVTQGVSSDRSKTET